MIDRQDIINVADSLRIDIDESIIEEVFNQYDNYAGDEEHSTWDLIVERMLYEYHDKV